MSFYFNTTQTAATIKSTTVAVTCEKCGCNYYYEMIRLGTGISVAHYGFESGRPASTKAAAEASNRLRNEAEVVPCPQCHWINEDLVQRYRNARFRDLGIGAIGVAIFGCGGPLIWALVMLGTAQGDAASIPYVIGWGSFIGILSAISLLLLQARLKNQFQPNRFYPNPPDLPIGTPPALLLNDRKELVLARPDAALYTCQTPAGSFDFQVGKYGFPDLCCQCLEPANPKSAISIDLILGASLQVPHCVRCSQLVSVKKLTRVVTATFVIFAAMTLLMLLCDINNSELWLIAGAVSIGLGWGVVECALTPVPAKLIDGSRGIVRLSSLNPEFYSRIGKLELVEEPVPDFTFLAPTTRD